MTEPQQLTIGGIYMSPDTDTKVVIPLIMLGDQVTYLHLEIKPDKQTTARLGICSAAQLLVQRHQLFGKSVPEWVVGTAQQVTDVKIVSRLPRPEPKHLKDGDGRIRMSLVTRHTSVDIVVDQEPKATLDPNVIPETIEYLKEAHKWLTH